MKRVVLALSIALAAFAPTGSALSADPTKRDEFGVIPEDGADTDLSLPDPVLDRSWPTPSPGAPDRKAPKIAPDEENVDPFASDPPERPKPPAEHEILNDPVPPRPAHPIIGPDGTRDTGPSSRKPDADSGEPLDSKPREPGNIEDVPSPLDESDKDFANEPGELGDR